MEEPWPEMFGDAAMATLSDLMNLQSPASAQADFVALGHKIRAVIDITPTSFKHGPDDIPLSRRARWLARHVLNPAALLRAALIDDPKFAEYPETHSSSISPEDRRAIAGKLEHLEAFARDLHEDLDYRAKQKKLRHNIEMRREFLFWIAQVVRQHGRDKAGKRISNKRSYTGVESELGLGKGDTSPFVTAIRFAYMQIANEAPPLDNHFKEIVKMRP